MAAAVSWPKLADTTFCRASVFAGTFLKSVVPSPSSPAPSVPPILIVARLAWLAIVSDVSYRNCLFLCCFCLHENQSLFLNINFHAGRIHTHARPFQNLPDVSAVRIAYAIFILGYCNFSFGGGYNENITSQLYRMLENTQK